MARVREFERKKVLESAMEVFWTKGYHATSMRDLTLAMGLSKSSLYDCFGSKHQLFLESIDLYCTRISAQLKFVTELKIPARQIIISVLSRAVDRILEPQGRRGCFLNNCAVEISPIDPVAAARCRVGIDVMEKTFLQLVRRAQIEGTILCDKDAQSLARYLNCTVNGILVLGKANPDRNVLGEILRVAISNL